MFVEAELDKALADLLRRCNLLREQVRFVAPRGQMAAQPWAGRFLGEPRFAERCFAQVFAGLRVGDGEWTALDVASARGMERCRLYVGFDKSPKQTCTEVIWLRWHVGSAPTCCGASCGTRASCVWGTSGSSRWWSSRRRPCFTLLPRSLRSIGSTQTHFRAGGRLWQRRRRRRRGVASELRVGGPAWAAPGERHGSPGTHVLSSRTMRPLAGRKVAQAQALAIEDTLLARRSRRRLQTHWLFALVPPGRNQKRPLRLDSQLAAHALPVGGPRARRLPPARALDRPPPAPPDASRANGRYRTTPRLRGHVGGVLGSTRWRSGGRFRVDVGRFGADVWPVDPRTTRGSLRCRPRGVDSGFVQGRSGGGHFDAWAVLGSMSGSIPRLLPGRFGPDSGPDPGASILHRSKLSMCGRSPAASPLRHPELAPR